MSQERKDFYANSVAITTNIYEITLAFRTQSPVATVDGKAKVIEASDEVTVRMSPQHAKSLVALLVKHVSDYEKAHHIRLPVPPELQAFWNAYVKASIE